jgi:hypothetical protein
MSHIYQYVLSRWHIRTATNLADVLDRAHLYRQDVPIARNLAQVTCHDRISQPYMTI